MFFICNLVSSTLYSDDFIHSRRCSLHSNTYLCLFDASFWLAATYYIAQSYHRHRIESIIKVIGNHIQTSRMSDFPVKEYLNSILTAIPGISSFPGKFPSHHFLCGGILALKLLLLHENQFSNFPLPSVLPFELGDFFYLFFIFVQV